MGAPHGMDGFDRRWLMPVTKAQAQMLAILAAACRPHGATRWDEAGIMAALAKVRHLSLADVTLATIRAADDREIQTPGVIGNPTSTCWKERAANRAPARHEWADDAHRCRTCSLPRGECERLWQDHVFEPVTDHKRDPDSIARINASLREALREPVEHHPDHEPTTEGTEHVAPIRAALAAARAEGDADA